MKNDSSNNQSIFLLGPSSPFRGGIAHYNTLLFNQLCKDHEVLFYTFKKQYFQWLFPGKGDKDNSIDKIEPDTIRVDKNNGSRVRRELHPLQLAGWIRAGKEARKYPLIILPWWVVFWVPYYLLFLTFARNGRIHNRIIFLCHNVDEHENGLAGRLKRFLTRCVLLKGDGFILHSHEQERQLSRLLKKKNLPAVVSPHPLYQVFNKNRYTSVSAREKLGIPAQQRVILFFGFIREYKGLESLLKALPLVKTYDQDILLLIVGEVWKGERHYLRYTRLIKELGLEENTRFINRYVPNEEVEMYFKASDFVVLPYRDGSGSGILQIAYGMDRPVVATNISAFAEVVENEKTGLLVPPADETLLAETIVKMYKSGGIPHMEAEIRNYKKRFAWSLMAERIMQFYNS
jgi:glycosyltransferase involved in cell wall biosynthesis